MPISFSEPSLPLSSGTGLDKGNEGSGNEIGSMQVIIFYAHALSSCERRRGGILGAWPIHRTYQQIISEENLKGQEGVRKAVGPKSCICPLRES